MSIFADGAIPDITYIRPCYVQWSNSVLAELSNDPKTLLFALSSSPGCGKTSLTPFLFKMIRSMDIFKDVSIVYQYETEAQDQVSYVYLDKLSPISLKNLIRFILLMDPSLYHEHPIVQRSLFLPRETKLFRNGCKGTATK